MSQERKPLLQGSSINVPIEEEVGDEGHGTFLTSTFNMVNAAVGAGVLAFPSAFRTTGLVSGLLVAGVRREIVEI
jgi:hypothetical protein